MASTNYSKLRVLIIEDFANFSSALRMMLSQLGVSEIEIAISGEKALPLMTSGTFDIVLSDYNLGEGRNGNDLLEEAKQNKLLRSDCIYIMITAESGTEMVMGALEYQPDEYLTKPFTKEILYSRLERLLTRREALLPIYRAIDKGQISEAAQQCDTQGSEYPRYKSYLLKLRAELLMELNAYNTCRALCQQILGVKFIPWTQLALGKSYFYQQDYVAAEKAFRELLSLNKGYVHAWDWLARCQEQTGDPAAAQQSLMAAAKISPINVSRQSTLGRLAVSNGDMEQAERALSKSVKVGKYSVNRSPDNYLQLASVISQRVADVNAVTAKRMEQKALTAMDELRSLYRGDAQVGLASRLAEQQLYQAQGKEAEVAHALLQAFDLCKKDKQGTLPTSLKEQLIGRLQQTGQSKYAEDLVGLMQNEVSHRNGEAAELYAKGDIEQALAGLQLAVEEQPRNISSNLNLAQVAMHSMVQNGIDAMLMQQVGAALSRVKSIPEASQRFKLYQDLRMRYQKLLQKQAQA
ncbi:MAG: DNA-binding response OmpR family regulator/Tfp pilus assembly protein PilF [Motiliproteus sp.]